MRIAEDDVSWHGAFALVLYTRRRGVVDDVDGEGRRKTGTKWFHFQK